MWVRACENYVPQIDKEIYVCIKYAKYRFTLQIACFL